MMKRTLLFLFLAIISNSLFSQDTIKKTTSEATHPFVIKSTPTAILVPNLYVVWGLTEVKLGEKSSIQLGFGYLKNGFKIKAEFRHYYHKEDNGLNGFYLAPEI